MRKLNWLRFGLLAIVISLLTYVLQPVSRPSTPSATLGVTTIANAGGFGVLGDSSSDEYRADDARGGTYGATTLVWVEQLVKSRNADFGAWGSWGGHRRRGYEYNWSRSGATAGSMIAAAAHMEMAKLVEAGKVKTVFVNIGANDFAYYNDGAKIYSGALTGGLLETKIQKVIADITLAVATVKAADPARLIISTVPDFAMSPIWAAKYPDAAKRAKVSAAITKVNQALAGLSAREGATLFSSEANYQLLMAKIDAAGVLTIGGQKISLMTVGNEPHNGTLADGVHIGTAFSGIYANLFIEHLNKKYNLNIEPLTDYEILRNSGLLAAGTPTPTRMPTQLPTHPPTFSRTPTGTVASQEDVNSLACMYFRLVDAQVKKLDQGFVAKFFVQNLHFLELYTSWSRRCGS